MAMELLLEYGKIEWQGTLRKTYNKYFHPDVLEMESPEMFDMLYQGHVLNAFQFETNVGAQALNKINPQNFDELCAGNSLMRLSTDGEQPLDRFVRFKRNIAEWYQEMVNEGLTEDEIKILEDRLLDRYGVCDTQEGLMLLSMDPNIAGFNLTQANKFRKAVAKQNQKLIEDQKILFYEHGLNRNTRQEFLDYVWNKQLAPQFGYAFSLPHIAGYTMILMIEMNICYRYGPIFWKTACLSVNAGLIGENTGGVNYSAISKAIGDMKSSVLSPDINLSDMGFTPLEEENKILYGLKPIVGLGVDAIEAIIENRPYQSFEDFLTRIIDEKLISQSKGVTLIKAGCFDQFNTNRRQLMTEYVRRITPKREKLTMVQFPVISHLVDKEMFKKELEIYEFRHKIQGRNKVPMNKDIELQFIKKYSDDVEYDFENGQLVINEKSWNKFYGKKIERLKDWVTSPEAVEQFNKIKMQDYWRSNCSGTVESWEMETTLFYSDKHELDYMPVKNYFNLASFEDLPEEPVVASYSNYRVRQIPRFQISVIAGTVVQKNKGKSLVSVITPEGVVTVRYSKGQFSHYDKKVVQVEGKDKKVLDQSWFERGTKLILVGFRRGDEFVLRTTGSQFKHSTMKINGYNNERLFLQMEKVEE